MSQYGNLDAFQLYQRRYKLLEEMSELEAELNDRRAQNRHVMRAEEQVWKTWSEMMGLNVAGGSTPGRQAELVTPELGFNVHNFSAVLLEVPPGSKGGAYHTHGEAVKHYVQGEGVEIIGDKQYNVKAGDTVFIPADTWHGTQNNTSEPVRILAVSHSDVGVPLVKRIVLDKK